MTQNGGGCRLRVEIECDRGDAFVVRRAGRDEQRLAGGDSRVGWRADQRNHRRRVLGGDRVSAQDRQTGHALNVERRDRNGEARADRSRRHRDGGETRVRIRRRADERVVDLQLDASERQIDGGVGRHRKRGEFRERRAIGRRRLIERDDRTYRGANRNGHRHRRRRVPRPVRRRRVEISRDDHSDLRNRKGAARDSVHDRRRRSDKFAVVIEIDPGRRDALFDGLVLRVLEDRHALEIVANRRLQGHDGVRQQRDSSRRSGHGDGRGRLIDGQIVDREVLGRERRITGGVDRAFKVQRVAAPQPEERSRNHVHHRVELRPMVAGGHTLPQGVGQIERRRLSELRDIDRLRERNTEGLLDRQILRRRGRRDAQRPRRDVVRPCNRVREHQRLGAVALEAQRERLVPRWNRKRELRIARHALDRREHVVDIQAHVARKPAARDHRGHSGEIAGGSRSDLGHRQRRHHRDETGGGHDLHPARRGNQLDIRQRPQIRRRNVESERRRLLLIDRYRGTADANCGDGIQRRSRNGDGHRRDSGRQAMRGESSDGDSAGGHGSHRRGEHLRGSQFIANQRSVDGREVEAHRVADRERDRRRDRQAVIRKRRREAGARDRVDGQCELGAEHRRRRGELGEVHGDRNVFRKSSDAVQRRFLRQIRIRRGRGRDAIGQPGVENARELVERLNAAAHFDDGFQLRRLWIGDVEEFNRVRLGGEEHTGADQCSLVISRE